MERSKIWPISVFVGVVALQVAAFQNCAQETGGLSLGGTSPNSGTNVNGCLHTKYDGAPRLLTEGETFLDEIRDRPESAQCPAGSSGTLTKYFNLSRTVRCRNQLLQMVVPETKTASNKADTGSCTASPATCRLVASTSQNGSPVASGGSYQVGTQIFFQVQMVTNPASTSFQAYLTGPDYVQAGNPNGILMGAPMTWVSTAHPSAGSVTRTGQIRPTAGGNAVNCSNDITLTYTPPPTSGMTCSLRLLKNENPQAPGSTVQVAQGDILSWSISSNPSFKKWQFIGPDILAGGTGKADNLPFSTTPETLDFYWTATDTIFYRNARVSDNGTSNWVQCPETYTIRYLPASPLAVVPWNEDSSYPHGRWSANPMVGGTLETNSGQMTTDMTVTGLTAGERITGSLVRCDDDPTYSGTINVAWPVGGQVTSSGSLQVKFELRVPANTFPSIQSRRNCLMRLSTGSRSVEFWVLNIPARPQRLLF